MCGIGLWISSPSTDFASSPHYEPLRSSLLKRGPDSYQETRVSIHAGAALCVASSVLHLRGKDAQCTVQPLTDSESRNVLAWNGEVFDGIHVPLGENDGLHLLAHVSQATRSKSLPDEPVSSPAHIRRKVCRAMSFAKGPWAFAFYHAHSRQLFFGRDFFGRRSLLWHKDDADLTSLVLASVASETTVPIDVLSRGGDDGSDGGDGGEGGEDAEAPGASTSASGVTGFWSEVPASGIFCLSFSSERPELHHFPWHVASPTQRSALLSGGDEDSADAPSPPYSFVGLLNRSLPAEEACARLRAATWTPTGDSLRTATMAGLASVLSEAVRRRVQALPAVSSGLAPGDGHARIAVLFSGGIDSMILAALAHAHLPPHEKIDLVNVAFENTARGKGKKGLSPIAPDAIFNVPDRLTGRAGWQELEQAVRNGTILHTLEWARSAHPSASAPASPMHAAPRHPDDPDETAPSPSPSGRYRLVEVNVTRAEYDAAILHVASLMQPLRTVMDLSIAMALWFAARGQGQLHALPPSEPSPYAVSARVLLVGMGADEQFAGYGRHRTRFETAGWAGLLAEVALDTGRISSRNLGRDDRCISDHGRESRLPYLDEDVVAYLNSLPVHEKANMYLPRGRGEKSLLRGLGCLLGLPSAAQLAKRAIQFGARTARMDPGSSVKGQARLQFATQP